MTGSNSITVPSRDILIVDDEEIVLAGLRESLRLEGHRVLSATSPGVALEILQRQEIAVIISDQQMPEMNGLEFLSLAKVIRPHAARILVTAALSLDALVEAINKSEIYRLLIKPWLREELLATVRLAIQRYESAPRTATPSAATDALKAQLDAGKRSFNPQAASASEPADEILRQNAALFDELRDSARLCLRVLQTFYPVLGSQARRTVELCRAMAELLSLPPDQQRFLEISAYLQDVGLIGVPRELVHRWQRERGSLTDAERALMEQHPALGQELVCPGPRLKTVGVLIRAHHERFDGGGFPDGLTGERIPWPARLLAAAAGCAESEFAGKDPADAVRRGSGTAFDPQVAEACLSALPRVTAARASREVSLAELRPGLELAESVHTPEGLLLLSAGERLTAAEIARLLKHDRVDPIRQALAVFEPESGFEPNAAV